jgi:ABC-type transport system involved in multi-copper enzyme maturation permease subunit
LRDNPIYLRERGEWGRANPFYERLARYWPLVALGALILGFCAAAGNPAIASGNELIAGLWCLLCFPNMLSAVLTLYGSFMLPALTAPSVSMELDRGTWDILRATPYPDRTILRAKLWGAMGRLRIWWLLLIAGGLQGAAAACFFAISAPAEAVWAAVIGPAVVARPVAEVLFAGCLGFYFSTRIRSAMTALAAAYGGVFVLKLLNNSGVWTLIGRGLALEEGGQFVMGVVVPAAVYGILIIALLALPLRSIEL